MVISLYLFAVLVTGDTFFEDELNRIDTYEVVTITHQFDPHPSPSANRIEFTAFNQFYSIELTPNPDIVASNIRHSNGNPTIQHHLEQYFTHLTTSCHYFGKVLNSNHNSQVALSICDKRGVRGSITAFNHTLIIKPSKYYLDIAYDRTHYHDINDPHLVFKLSDYHASFPPTDRNTANLHHTHNRRLLTPIIFDPITHNNVEMYILSDPVFTSYYLVKYPMNWYDQLVSHFADQIHSVSAEYLNTDWGRAVGTINLSLVEVEIAHLYSGPHKSLTPVAFDAACTDIQRWDGDCTADASRYLMAFGEYIRNYKNVSTFDNAQLWTKMRLSQGRSGLAMAESVCKGASSSAVVSSHLVGDIGSVTVSAHVLGHNFGLRHDGTYGSDCDAAEGLMGSRPNGFSSCSVTALQEFYTSHDMQCLLNSVHVRQTLPVPNRPNDIPSDGESSEKWSCVHIAHMGDAALNGDWSLLSNPNQYKLDGSEYYLYWIRSADNINYWVISSLLLSQDWESTIQAYCTATSTRLMDCSYAWMLRTDELQTDPWIQETNALVDDCATHNYNQTDNTSSTDPSAHVPANWCLRLVDSEVADFNGFWLYNGTHLDGDVYALEKENGTLFLYYSIATQEWDISSVRGSADRDDILASCRMRASSDTVLSVKDCPPPWIVDNKPTRLTFGECDPSCVGLQDMNSAFLDGEWMEMFAGKQTVAFRKVYSLNALYLYYTSGKWIISRSLSAKEEGMMWAYCAKQDLLQCADSWFIWERAFIEDTVSSVYECTSDEDRECTSYACVGIRGLDEDVAGNDYNGRWEPKGCHFGKTHYAMKGRNETWRSLCYNNMLQGWVITDQVCEGTRYAFCPKEDVMDCGNVWFAEDGTKLDTSSHNMMSDCSQSNETNWDGSGIDGLAWGCRGWHEDAKVLCVFDNGTLWSGGYQMFNSSEWMCVANKSVYTYEVMDVSYIMRGKVSYYIYFETYEDEEGAPAEGDWVIVENKLRGNIKSKCGNKDLMTCTAGQWSTQVEAGDTVAFEIDNGLHVLSGACHPSADEKNGKKGAGSTVAIAVVMGCILVIVIIVIVVCIKKKKSLKKGGLPGKTRFQLEVSRKMPGRPFQLEQSLRKGPHLQMDRIEDDSLELEAEETPPAPHDLLSIDISRQLGMSIIRGVTLDESHPTV